VIPAYDRKVNPDWPHPDHSPLERARWMARTYRAALRDVDTARADRCDERARRFGETWLLEHEDLIDDHTELTTAEAAELAGVSVGTLRNWACLPHPEREGETLLPRFGKRGRETLYLAGAVREAVKAARRAQHARTM
jgi:hypothetical protein